MDYYYIKKSKGRYREYRDHNKNKKMFASESSKDIKTHNSRTKRKILRSTHSKYSGKRLNHPDERFRWVPKYPTFIQYRDSDESCGDKCPQCQTWFCTHSRYVVVISFLIYNNIFPTPIAQKIAKIIYNDKQWNNSNIFSCINFNYIYKTKLKYKDRIKYWWE